MKYMNFNRSCSYTCLADMVEDFGLDYDDVNIAKEMKLGYLFFDDANNNRYLSGPMLQGKLFFDLFFNPHSLEFIEEIIPKSKIIDILKNLQLRL